MKQKEVIDARYYSVKENGKEVGQFVPIPQYDDDLGVNVLGGLVKMGERIGGLNGKSLKERFSPMLEAVKNADNDLTRPLK